MRGSPAAPSCLEERAPSWLSGDCCARPLCHTISLHNGGYMCSTGSETDLKEEFNGSISSRRRFNYVTVTVKCNEVF